MQFLSALGKRAWFVRFSSLALTNRAQTAHHRRARGDGPAHVAAEDEQVAVLGADALKHGGGVAQAAVVELVV
jgi:hypothetical protein